MSRGLSRLEPVEVGRARPGSRVLEGRAKYASWLTQPLWQLHFVIDGVSVRERLLSLELPEPYGFGDFDMVSVADAAWPDEAALALRRLMGQEDQSENWGVLDEGRLPLYVCQECGDVYCGAITVAVRRAVDPTSGVGVVRWEQMRYEDAQTPADEMPDLSAVGPFTFDAQQYDRTLSGPLVRLDQLVEAEHRTQVAWKERRRISSRLRRACHLTRPP